MASDAQERQTTIAGETFTLRFSTMGVGRLETKWGTDLNGVFEKIKQPPSVNVTCDLLWAALRVNHPDVPHGDVEKLLDRAGIFALTGILDDLVQTLLASQPRPDEVADARPPKAKAAKAA